jgi:hypothetical protein
MVEEPTHRIFKVLESEEEYHNAKNGIISNKPESVVAEAHRHNEPATATALAVPAETTGKGKEAAQTLAPQVPVAPVEKPPNACCFLYVSPSLCPPNAQTVSFAQDSAEKGEADNIDFYVCDVASNIGQIAAKLDKVGALPTFCFYYKGQLLENFSGESGDKFKICCKAALAKRQAAIKQKEKEDVDKAAAIAAAGN